MMACFVVGRVTDVTASSHVLFQQKVVLLSFVLTSTKPTQLLLKSFVDRLSINESVLLSLVPTLLWGNNGDILAG